MFTGSLHFGTLDVARSESWGYSHSECGILQYSVMLVTGLSFRIHRISASWHTGYYKIRKLWTVTVNVVHYSTV